jgi:hypothetical protein
MKINHTPVEVHDPEITISITLRRSEWKSMKEVFGSNSSIPAGLRRGLKINDEEQSILTVNMGSLYDYIRDLIGN